MFTPNRCKGSNQPRRPGTRREGTGDESPPLPAGQ